MRKFLSITFLFLGCVLQLHTENISNKLRGNILGTTNCFNYTTNSCSTTINTALNAFDDNLQNTFATCERTGGWAGMDLGTNYVITKIAYCPRTGIPGRMLLGVFEGANLPDFGDAIPLFLVKDLPAENILTTKTINCSKGFRYVRYVGPNNVKCNIAEIEFYGYNSIGDNSSLTQITNLPTVIIHTSNAQDIVEKDTYIKGIVSVISENGTEIFTDSLEIKGRGNASWKKKKKNPIA